MFGINLAGKLPSILIGASLAAAGCAHSFPLSQADLAETSPAQREPGDREIANHASAYPPDDPVTSHAAQKAAPTVSVAQRAERIWPRDGALAFEQFQQQLPPLPQDEGNHSALTAQWPEPTPPPQQPPASAGKVTLASFERAEPSPAEPPSFDRLLNWLEASASPDSVRDQVAVRVVQVALGHPVAPVPAEWDEPEIAFWKHQLAGLEQALAEDSSPAEVRARQVARHLEKALHELRQQAGLELNELHFCREVNSFGDYRTLNPRRLHAGQEVLLYVEIANHCCRCEASQYETAFESRYRIERESGEIVAEQAFPHTKDRCRHRRQDYFHTYRFHLPKSLAPGSYRLHLQVEDRVGEKTSEASIAFEIQAKSPLLRD